MIPQVFGEERVRDFDHLVEPDLFTEKRMRCVFDDSQAGLDALFLHCSAKSVCVSAGIVRFAGNEPAGWVIFIKVMQWRSKTIGGGPVLLCAAKKLSPDLATIRVRRDFSRSS